MKKVSKLCETHGQYEYIGEFDIDAQIGVAQKGVEISLIDLENRKKHFYSDLSSSQFMKCQLTLLM